MPLPAIAPALASLGSALASSVLQYAFNRADFDYTHGKTNIPAQVSQMKEAGLNPALAYGQISAPQGQALGNHQQDFSQLGKNLSQIPLIQQQVDTGKAEENYYNALAFKTQQDGLIAQFNALHQEDVFNLDYEYYGLRNRNYQLGNDNLSLRNDWQRIENGIRRIDWSAHNQVIEADLQKSFAQMILFGAQANSINRKLPYEIANLAAGSKELITRARLNQQNVYFTAAQQGNLKYVSKKLGAEYEYLSENAKYIFSLREGQDLVNAWERYLTDDGKNMHGKTNREMWFMIGESLGNLVPSIGLYRSFGPKAPKVNPIGYKR